MGEGLANATISGNLFALIEKILKHVGGITIPFITESLQQDEKPREIRFSETE